MEKNVSIIVCAALALSAPVFSDSEGSLSTVREQTQELYRTGSGAQDATYSTVGRSMWAWGIGLSAAIAILASAIHQSAADDTSN